MNRLLEQILLTRHILVAAETKSEMNSALANAYLLANCGIVVDNPSAVSMDNIGTVAEMFKIYIPRSYFDNPQDMKYYKKDELVIEQIISYFLAYGADNSHIEVFKKDLPEYTVNGDLHLRTVRVVTPEQADIELANIARSLAAYTRPWGYDEFDEFDVLFNNGYVTSFELGCRSNAIKAASLLDMQFISNCDYKDLVKYSINTFGESANIRPRITETDFVKKALALVKPCSLSKKQAKYFNTICKACGKEATASNSNSPYKSAMAAFNAGKYFKAAKIFSNNGSLLERNLKMLLSRVNDQEAAEILSLVQAKNPIALYQLVLGLCEDNGSARTFNFKYKNLVKIHTETSYEAMWRKSVISDTMKIVLHDLCLDKIATAYSANKLGKAYIGDMFYKLALPMNTSASGKGIDILPTGSRTKITSDKVRTFVYWNNSWDIDSTLILIDNEGNRSTVSFSNFAYRLGGGNIDGDLHNAIWFSGDCTARDGSEFYDLDLAELKSRGYKYIVQSCHGFAADFSSGDIHAGYQVKSDFNSRAWDPKNIAMQMKLTGESREFSAFAFDLENNEVITLNLMSSSHDRCVSAADATMLLKYLNPSYLDLNIGTIASMRYDLVDNIDEADVVFDDKYQSDTKQVVRSYELEKLVNLITL